MTLLLSRSDLARLLDVEACLTALRDGFTAEPAIAPQRVRTDLPGPGTATALVPGLLDGVPAYTVKVNAKFPAARPALRGVVCLHDLATGELLALLDSATLTAWRTGLAAAVGTDVLAGHGAGTVAVIGAGAQAELVVRGLAALRSWTTLLVCDLDAARAEDFAGRHGGTVVSGRPAADIVVLATWSRTPLLDDHDLRPGAHVTSLGADEPGKAELTTALLAASRVVVDDVPLAVATGALGTAGLDATAAAGTLGEVLRGTLPARRDDAERTVYTPVGLPWQDLALAWLAYRRALDTGSGREFDFLT
jgi:alanine dehydrogenase